ncbi:hypothetical protein M1M38_gp105 [Halorubrum tailed virus 27]|uniref:Uncharacterized protein n=1 Tax=Halorubrum tailed virus 27 TaxID=2878008 RepID=A0AAE8Y190_9CAUD|nr:hypothetical protein M1M38_gp105 [Halorubrum tailed virus 27]UBF22798.1 hypothetical protein HRTV-27_gp105 [Halorubrum tailed virus 27]
MVEYMEKTCLCGNDFTTPVFKSGKPWNSICRCCAATGRGPAGSR